MNPTYVARIAQELTIPPLKVQAVKDLLNDGATIPFISRYRKEATGSLDEVAVAAIRDRLTQLEELDGRRQAIMKSLEQHGHLTDELEEKVIRADTMPDLEDIYLPYRPKRRTKGMMAREKGLSPLAELILDQTGRDPMAAAADFVDTEKGVADATEALSGARDIIAEICSEDETVRKRLRHLFFTKSILKSRMVAGKEKDGAKYRDYFEWEEPASSAPSHRILAMRRGEREDFLNISVAPPAEDGIRIVTSAFVTGDGDDAEQVRKAVHDAYKRLLSRAMETEVRLSLKEQADQDAIQIFADNLRQLLLSPPLGSKRIMGIDPGFRTGCKVVCLDQQGKLLHNDTIYPNLSSRQTEAAGVTIMHLQKKYAIEAIAVGNGTAGRETEAFLRNLTFATPVQIVMVNESGASIYSASATARNEFPDHDVTVRGSVSIGRRLMDPLSELVKIDPKSIGVGQYQHDVDQTSLKQTLDDVVVSCVNGVGVDVNRASVQLLSYVSGLGPRLAKNIVAYRDENGPFADRKDLKNVPRLGPKAFEQSAGFLRIRDGRNRLDGSAVHPESYSIVDRMAADLSCSVVNLMQTPSLRSQVTLQNYVTDAIGLPTLEDIMAELAKPGRDPREEFEAFGFAAGINTLDDLEPGMKLPGIVTNVTAFGAFVDIGVHQDGLVHISQLADKFVKDPAKVVKVQQKVSVTVLEVDMERKRIALSLKSNPSLTEAGSRKPRKEVRPKAPPRKQPQKPVSPKKQPFNNPFADAFGKR